MYEPCDSITLHWNKNSAVEDVDEGSRFWQFLESHAKFLESHARLQYLIHNRINL